MRLGRISSGLVFLLLTAEEAGIVAELRAVAKRSKACVWTRCFVHVLSSLGWVGGLRYRGRAKAYESPGYRVNVPVSL